MSNPKDKVTKAEGMKIDIMKPPKPTTSIKNPMSMGSVSVKLPKTKMMGDGFGKPSLLLKNDDFGSAKHPSVQKLRDFLQRTRHKK